MPILLFSKIKIVIIIFFLSSNLYCQVNNNDTTSVLKKQVELEEVIIKQDQYRKISGSLTGRILLNVEGVKGLPSISGNIDLIKMLEMTPGVQTSGDGNSNLYIRGGEPGQNLFLYNGNMLYTPGHILSLFPIFNVNHISSVELSKSGFDAQYNGFLSSAINTQSKQYIPVKTNVMGNIGLLSSQITFDVPFSNNWGAFLSGRKSYLKLLLDPLLNKTINNGAKNELNNVGYDFYDVNMTVVGNLSIKNKLIIDAFYSLDNLDIRDDDVSINSYLKWKNYLLSACLISEFANKRLEQYITFSKYNNWISTTQAEMSLSIVSDVADFGYKNRLIYNIQNVAFESGVGYNYYNILPQESTMKNLDLTYTNQTIKETNAHSFFAFTSSKLNLNRFMLEPGLRYTMFNSRYKNTKNKLYQSVDVRFSGRYRLNELTYLRLGFSYNTQYLNKLTPSSLGLPTDFWVAASSEILPQKGAEISFGGYRSLNDNNYEVSTDIYYRKMKNVTEFNQGFIENNNLPLTDKIYFGKGNAFGLELFLKKNTGKLTGWISYAIGKSDRFFPDLNNRRTFPARFDRRHDLSVVASYFINNRWDMALSYKYATGNAYTQPSSWYFINGMPVKDYDKYNGSRMPDYNRTDFSLNYWFKKDNGLNFSVYNMFMVNNPIYIFILVKNDGEDNLKVEVKYKKLLTIIPSVSWRFKF